jgi:hypothetical protein
MTDVKQLNLKVVGYVYDALFCKESDARISGRNNEYSCLEFNVFTTAKIG